LPQAFMSTAMQETLRLVVDPELIRRFDISGPRYTSYPTADRFVEAFGPAQYARWLGSARWGGSTGRLSLYVHIPFCNTICSLLRLQQDHHQGSFPQRALPRFPRARD